MGKRRQIMVQDVPEPIRVRFVAEARERDLSLTQLAVEIVARCHGVDVMIAGQSLRKGTTGELPWVMRFPAELVDALDADGRRVARGRLVVNCLAEHYGLPPESPLNRSLAQPRGEAGRFVGRS